MANPAKDPLQWMKDVGVPEQDVSFLENVARNRGAIGTQPDVVARVKRIQDVAYLRLVAVSTLPLTPSAHQ